jgi:hypothetical protein
MALARALVMGPCGGLGDLEAEVSEGHPISDVVEHVSRHAKSTQEEGFQRK